MKKLLLSFVALISLLVPALIIAETTGEQSVSTTFSTEGYSNANDVTELTKGPITFSFSKGTGSNAPKYYDNGTSVRLYVGNTLTISGTDCIITKVVFNYAGNNYNFGEQSNLTTFTETGTTGTWEGTTIAPLTFTAPQTHQTRIVSIVVSYTVDPSVVVFSPASGTLNKATEVTLSSIDKSATIHYTTDGTDPTDESTVYSAPVTVDEAMTIKAKVEGNTKISTAEYTFETAAPLISDEGSKYSDHTITIVCETKDATIYYTTDGTEPTEVSKKYEEPFIISEPGTTTVNAIAVSDFGTSTIASYDVKISPAVVFTPVAGSYPDVITVSITSPVDNAAIYYTTDGTDPTEGSTEYTEPFVVDHNTTVKAIAVFDGTTSHVIEAVYKIDDTVKKITFDFNDPDLLDWADIDEMPDAANNPDEKNNAQGWVVNKLEKDGLTVTLDNSTAGSAAQSYRLWYNKGVQLRLAKSGANDASTMTFTAPEGSKITTIIFTGNNNVFNYTPSKGKIEKEDDQNVWTWTGLTETLVLTPGKFEDTMQLTSIAVTCSESNAPVFNYETGEYYETFNVTMTTDLPGGKIYYTLDGSDPTTESEEYKAPVEIEKGEVGATTTVKAIAAGKRVNPVSNKEEDYVSEITEAVYTWAELDKADTEIVTISQLINWFTTAEQPENLATIKDPAKIKWIYPNIDKVVEFTTGLTVTAVTPNALYLDDTFDTQDEITSVVLTSSAVDFTELYQPDDILENLVVGFKWLNDVTPSLTLKGVPVEPSTISGNYEFEPVTVTVDSIIASAEWNSYDIYLATENNKWSTANNPKANIMVPRIEIANPLLVSKLVKIEGLNVTKDISGNMSKSIPCVSADGKSINIVTEINLGDYSAGKYDIEAIVAYDVNIIPEKTNKDGDITQEADTIITPYLIPAKIFGESGEITKATFTATEEVTEGYLLLVADGHAMTALPFNKSYGYAPATKVNDEDGEISINPEDALRIVPVDVDLLSRSADARFFIMDSYGRYYYQTGTFNSFNVDYELPEDVKEALWTFEPTDDEDGNTCMKVTNVSTGKWIQYSAKYGSWGCYPVEQEQGFIPVAYQTTATPSGVVEIAPAASSAATEVYDLRGIRMGSSLDGLTPGLYIIRRGNEVSKVLVR